MAKIDFKKHFKEYYSPSTKKVSFVTVPSFQYLMIDGKGTPGESEDYKNAIETIYPVTYKIMFLNKKTNPDKDYKVMPLEGLWWADDMDDFVRGNKENWIFTLMIMQPDFITRDLFEQAKAEVKKKKNIKTIDKLRLMEYEEGLCAQLLHIGPYSEEGPNINRIHTEIEARGGKFDGQDLKHHEIYLSDFRRTDPVKLKTVLRQPYTEN